MSGGEISATYHNAVVGELERQRDQANTRCAALAADLAQAQAIQAALTARVGELQGALETALASVAAEDPTSVEAHGAGGGG